jgi:hypothetical protein
MAFAFTPANPIGSLQKSIGVCSLSLMAGVNALDAFAKPACLLTTKPTAMSAMTLRNANETSPLINQSVKSLLNLVADMTARKGELATVKVPSRDYLGILHELKNHKAQILEAGSLIPSNARIVFEISDSANLKNIVCIF